MHAMHKMVIGLASVVALGVVTWQVNAGPSSPIEVRQPTQVAQAVTPLNSPETPQALVSDMTY